LPTFINAKGLKKKTAAAEYDRIILEMKKDFDDIKRRMDFTIYNGAESLGLEDLLSQIKKYIKQGVSRDFIVHKIVSMGYSHAFVEKAIGHVLGAN
jgi:uncharacterized protein YeeX (DUF496 family)